MFARALRPSVPIVRVARECGENTFWRDKEIYKPEGWRDNGDFRGAARGGMKDCATARRAESTRMYFMLRLGNKRIGAESMLCWTGRLTGIYVARAAEEPPHSRDEPKRRQNPHT
jgi:hypothetical protein